MKLKNLFFSIIAAAFLSSGISVDKTHVIGKLAPKIETVSGTNVVADGNSEEKIQVISFWNPKKPLSRINTRNLSRQYGENSKENVEFISICTDSDENLMREVMKVDGMNHDNNYSYSEVNPRVFKDYDVEKNPRAFMISADGKIINVL